jgi:hypothetical protein
MPYVKRWGCSETPGNTVYRFSHPSNTPVTELLSPTGLILVSFALHWLAHRFDTFDADSALLWKVERAAAAHIEKGRKLLLRESKLDAMRTSSETNCCTPVLAAILRLALALQSPVVTLCTSFCKVKKFYVLTVYELREDSRISRDYFHIQVKVKMKFNLKPMYNLMHVERILSQPCTIYEQQKPLRATHSHTNYK